MAEEDFYKRYFDQFDKEAFILFPQKQDVERRVVCSNQENCTFPIPVYATYWCESVRRDLNWCRHANYPFAALELILDGVIELVSSGSKYEAAAGDLLVFAPNQDRWYIQRQATHKIFIIIDGSFFKPLMHELGFQQDTLIHLEDREETAKQFRLIREAMELHSDIGCCRAAGLLWTLLLDLSRQFRQTKRSDIPVDIQKKSTNLKRGNMPRRKNNEIAEVFGVSTRSLYNIFRKYYDETPHQWQRHQQLERASLLLEMTEKSIAEIAAECDFRNPKYFMTLFKKVYGVTPGQWRRMKKDRSVPSILSPGYQIAAAPLGENEDF